MEILGQIGPRNKWANGHYDGTQGKPGSNAEAKDVDVGGKRHKSTKYYSDKTYRQCDCSCAQLYQCKLDLEKVTYSV